MKPPLQASPGRHPQTCLLLLPPPDHVDQTNFGIPPRPLCIRGRSSLFSPDNAGVGVFQFDIIPFNHFGLQRFVGKKGFQPFV